MFSQNTEYSHTPDWDSRRFYPCEIFLFHTPVPALGKDKNRTAAHCLHVDLWLHYAKMTSSCHISAYLGLFSSVFFQYKWGIKWWARKRNHYSSEDEIEKSVPRDHRMSSLGKPRDANRWSSGRIFLSHPHTHDRFLYSFTQAQLLLLGHRQTVIKNRCHRMHRLIRVFTACLQNVLSKFTGKWQIPPSNPSNGNGLVWLIRVGIPFGFKMG